MKTLILAAALVALSAPLALAEAKARELRETARRHDHPLECRVEPGSLDGYARALILFDGRDDGQLKQARDQWKALKGGGAPLSYWKQSPEGRWEKQV